MVVKHEAQDGNTRWALVLRDGSLPITMRPKINWPNGARLAVWVVPDLEFFPLTTAVPEHPFRPPGAAPSVRS